MISAPPVVQRAPVPQGHGTASLPAAPGRTGLPGRLKAGAEALAGCSLDDVRVHYGSPEPARIGAAAFTRGADIHVSPGEERHLPHEAWHAVQQKQGRVAATVQAKGVPINDARALEREADVMGARAATGGQAGAQIPAPVSDAHTAARDGVVQRKLSVKPTASFDGLSKAEAEKIETVLDDLNRVGAKVKPDVRVTLNVEEQKIEINTQPADTRVESDPPKTEYYAIGINIQKWYVAISSPGEIAGMLTHELGVHDLADIELGDYNINQELAENANEFESVAGSRKFKLKGWTEGDRRQVDHVNAVKYGALGTSPRMERYTETMLRIGDAIASRPATDATQKAAVQSDLNDLVDTFLFDIARMMATDDGKPFDVFFKSDDIAHVFNWYKAEVLKMHAGRYPWLNTQTIRGAKTTQDLRDMLETKSKQAVRVQASALASKSLERFKKWFG